MNSKRFLHGLLLGSMVWWFAGCGPAGDRCRKCGMLVDDHPRWVAGLVDENGVEERFCSPRCLFAHWRGPAGATAQDAWVTEYYTQEKMPLSEVRFVMGSDVIGPMGQALVPIAGIEEAEGFMRDHHGTRILSAEEITTDVLREIAASGRTDAAPSMP